MKRGRKNAEHRAEMEGRAHSRAERAERADELGPTPIRLPNRPTTTDKYARARIKANKQRADRRALRRLNDAMATAIGRRWHG
jgi:hypothetical protein